MDERKKSDIVEDLLKNGEKKIYDLNFKPMDLLLKEDQIIISHCDDKCLIIYDKELNFIKRVVKLMEKNLNHSIYQQILMKNYFTFVIV